MEAMRSKWMPSGYNGQFLKIFPNEEGEEHIVGPKSLIHFLESFLRDIPTLIKSAVAAHTSNSKNKLQLNAISTDYVTESFPFRIAMELNGVEWYTTTTTTTTSNTNEGPL